MEKRSRQIFKTLVPLAGLLALSACATHRSETEIMRAEWYAGNMPAAQDRALKGLDKKNDSGDRLVWLLEAGAVTRANASFTKSIEVFGSAIDTAKHFEGQAEIDMLNELKAMVLNQSYIPYKGYNYDKIMMSAYQALNYIETGRFDSAKTQLFQLMDYQQRAEAANAERILKEARRLSDAQNEDGKKAYNVDKTLSDPGAQAAFIKYYGPHALNPSADPSMRAKSVYVNPYAYWLIGTYFMANAKTASEREMAATAMRLASESIGGGNSFLAQDIASAERLANTLEIPSGITYVVYEGGSAPIRDQFKIDLPLFLISRSVPGVSLNFPYLTPQASYKPSVFVQAGPVSVNTQIIADMDEIIDREFKNELPSIIFKTVLSSAMKAGAQYAAQNATRDNDAAFIGTVIAGFAYQAMTNDADLRTWTTLPKQISIARVPTPGDGKVVVDGQPVSVSNKGINLIVAKQTSATAPLMLRSVSLSNNSK